MWFQSWPSFSIPHGCCLGVPKPEANFLQPTLRGEHLYTRCKGRIRYSPQWLIIWYDRNWAGLSRQIESKARKSETRKLKHWGKSRHKYWVHALIVGVLLTGEIHLFTAEILHHHSEVARVCQTAHRGGTYLHAAQERSPLCPL